MRHVVVTHVIGSSQYCWPFLFSFLMLQLRQEDGCAGSAQNIQSQLAVCSLENIVVITTYFSVSCAKCVSCLCEIGLKRNEHRSAWLHHKITQLFGNPQGPLLFGSSSLLASGAGVVFASCFAAGVVPEAAAPLLATAGSADFGSSAFSAPAAPPSSHAEVNLATCL